MPPQLISVIIPVYNGAQSLELCLYSLLDQTYKNYEIIVVDNASTDNSSDIILALQKKHPKIKYAFEAIRSRSAARNKGIALAQGEIILTTDSDCIVPINWIEELSLPILKHAEKAVTGIHSSINKNFWNIKFAQATTDFYASITDNHYCKLLDTKNFAIKASILKKMNFDPNLLNLEDFDLSMRLSHDQIKVLMLNKVAVKHACYYSAMKILQLQLNRGFWAVKIFRKHKNNIMLNYLPTKESMGFMSFILFPARYLKMFLQKPFLSVFFDLISETGWRLGIIWGALSPQKIYENYYKNSKLS